MTSIQEAETWPPNFDKESERRKKVSLIIRSSPNPIELAKERYANNCIQFIQDCCITYDPRNPTKGLPARMPFIPFNRQKELVSFILGLQVIQESGLVEKSRDMGATWICCAISVWLWLYGDGSAIGWGSRKEQLVDKIGDPDSIFEKIRMLIRTLPEYVLPIGFIDKEHLCYMKCINPENDSTITGEAGDNIGRGGRKSIYFKDESAHYERPELIEAALGDNTNVQVDISSVCGEGTVFHRKRMSKVVKVFIMDWRHHPAKDQAWYDKRKADAEAQGLNHIFSQEVDRDYAASVEGIFIPSEWVKAAIDSHLKLKFKPSGKKRAGLDVADEGGDTNALIQIHGQVVLEIDQWREGDTGVTAKRAWNECKKNAMDVLIYDSLGVGAGVKAKTNELIIESKGKGKPKNKLKVVGFAASSTGGVIDPDKDYVKDRTNKDMFSGSKAQAWWILRDRFHNTYKAVVEKKSIPESRLISLPSTLRLCNDLVSELSRPKREDDEAGKVRVESKKKMKKRGIKSPNLADALVMCFAPVANKTSLKDML